MMEDESAACLELKSSKLSDAELFESLNIIHLPKATNGTEMEIIDSISFFNSSSKEKSRANLN